VRNPGKPHCTFPLTLNAAGFKLICMTSDQRHTGHRG
jgi:hypothetical protein